MSRPGSLALGLCGALTQACAPPAARKEPPPAEGAAPRAPREPSEPPSPSASAPVVVARACGRGERLDRGCDCSAGRACFDICCGPDEACAHPLRPGGPSACMLRPKTSPTPPPAPSGPRLVFACDDKYASPSCSEAAWLPTQAAQAGGGLLEHEEGGPEGAVWNGSAALWLGVPEGARSVSFGGPLGAGKVVGSRRWYRVDPERWRRRLRNVAGKPYQAIAVLVDGRLAGAFWFAEGE